MTTEAADKAELFSSIDKTVSQLIEVMSSLEENEINTIPYKDSWTAAMVLRHITKSTNGMAKAMGMESMPAQRNPAEKVATLRDTFLDFSTKLQAPEFIVPEEGMYKKQETIEKLHNSFEYLKENAANQKLTDIVSGLPLGKVTKLEILHFVLYHTQRHLHQLEKIRKALQNK